METIMLHQFATLDVSCRANFDTQSQPFLLPGCIPKRSITRRMGMRLFVHNLIARAINGNSD